MKIRQRKILEFTAILLILVILNIFSANYFKRFDLTEDKRFTLSDYTKKTLQNIDGKLLVKVYLSGDDLPVQFKKFAAAIREELDLFRVYAGAKIDYQFVNPTDDKMTDTEKKALYKELAQLGIVPVEDNEVKDGKAVKTLIFPGAEITYTVYNKQTDSLISKTLGVNLLTNDPHYNPTSIENVNNSIQMLEYNLINIIKQISIKTKSKVVFLEGHGELPEPFVIDIEKSLSDYYEILRGAIGGRYGVLDSFAAVVIAKPTKPFSEKDKFVLDQYLMKGGKILWLVDGINVSMDSIYYYNKAFAFPAFTSEIKLEDLLFNYGVRINTDIVEDLQCSTILLKGQSSTGEERNYQFKWFYFPLLVSHNNNVINRYIDLVKTEFVSSIDTVGHDKDVRKIPLLTSSSMSKKVPVNVPLEIDFKQINDVPDPKLFTDKFIPVAYLLEGTFKSAWRGRIVNKMLPKGVRFLEKSKHTKMIVVADGDIIKNVVRSDGQAYPLGFDKYSWNNYPGNKQFIINAINYLCDDEGLMNLRSRRFSLRLLDKKQMVMNRSKWQLINLLLPILMVLLGGGIFIYFRNKKFSK